MTGVKRCLRCYEEVCFHCGSSKRERVGWRVVPYGTYYQVEDPFQQSAEASERDVFSCVSVECALRFI